MPLERAIALSLLLASAFSASQVLAFARYYTISRNVYDAAFGVIAAALAIGLCFAGITYWRMK